jgi:hypothetical protein
MTTKISAELNVVIRDHFLSMAREIVDEAMTLIASCDTPRRQADALTVLNAALEPLRAHQLDGGTTD